eukprot:TRINITY_DN72742_c0_g1_i1.p2 TRINITY_DN72742_c0_g1~~TRINITY_DN72742_c0_g1_i1.p2  ORF type:complete len:136 (+),score=11.83 TRINITY_DN72742_c0_g1_i1:60-467(+)
MATVHSMFLQLLVSPPPGLTLPLRAAFKFNPHAALFVPVGPAMRGKRRGKRASPSKRLRDCRRQEELKVRLEQSSNVSDGTLVVTQLATAIQRLVLGRSGILSEGSEPAVSDTSKGRIRDIFPLPQLLEWPSNYS